MYLIEDDDLKANRVMGYLEGRREDVQIVHLRSYQSGLKAIEAQVPHLLLLDMTMPTFDQGRRSREGRPRSMGGRDIMRKMTHKGLDCPVIVVTQFESFGEGNDSISYQQLRTACTEEFPALFHGMVQYHATSSAWEQELDVIFERLDSENTTR